MSADEGYMERALLLAEQAYSHGEVPVGAIVVIDGIIVGEGWNKPVSSCDPTAHAEMVALRDAASRIGNYRLNNATLYVTIEPCTMCAGALVHARVGRLVYGACEPKSGAVDSNSKALKGAHLNHQVLVTPGILGSRCAQLMSSFFKMRRQQKKEKTNQ